MMHDAYSPLNPYVLIVQCISHKRSAFCQDVNFSSKIVKAKLNMSFIWLLLSYTLFCVWIHQSSAGYTAYTRVMSNHLVLLSENFHSAIQKYGKQSSNIKFNAHLNLAFQSKTHPHLYQKFAGCMCVCVCLSLSFVLTDLWDIHGEQIRDVFI